MALPDNPVLFAVLLLLVLIVVFILHCIENNRLIKKLSEEDSDTKKEILIFSWSRTIQLIFALVFFFAIIFFYDYQFKRVLQDLETAQINLNLKQLIAESEAKKQASIVAQQAEAAPQIETTPPVVLSSDTNQETGIADIFTSAKNNPDPTVNVENIKSHYEELLVNYLLMEKCGKASSDDYKIIYAKMREDIQTANAPQDMASEILLAAKGSYEELYSRIECSEPVIESSSVKYKAYIKRLSDKLPNR